MTVDPDYTVAISSSLSEGECFPNVADSDVGGNTIAIIAGLVIAIIVLITSITIAVVVIVVFVLKNHRRELSLKKSDKEVID